MGLNHLIAVAFAAALLLPPSLLTPAIASVSYDRKAVIINGNRRILISGSIHYPRSTPEMWPDLIQKAKDGGLDVIQTYVFWNGHEPSPGQYYFGGRYDLVQFIKLVKQAGLYVHLRIGPYVCAEWNFGGFPVWLKYVSGISFRTDNGPFKAAMQKFTEKIVSMMKAEGLFESQGGPIILSQIENEFGPVEYGAGAPAKAYANWAAGMAVGLNTGVPWVMCKQDDAPDPVINTCNGFYCDYFSPNKPYKPTMWTEAWTGCITEEPILVGLAGGPFIATSYDYDAPIDEYGLLREPKWGHLRDLHRAIKLCEPALISSDPIVSSLGNSQQSHVFRSSSGVCAAFLSNYDSSSYVTVTFNGLHYNLPPWSISILPDCKTTVFNTARVGAQNSLMKMIPVGSFSWQSYNEETNSLDDSSFTKTGLYEQISLTWDKSDYLCVNIGQDEQFLKTGNYPALTALSAGDAMHVFVNGQYAGNAYGGVGDPKLTYKGNLKMWAGSNKISILSVAVGLPNVGTHFETWNAGILGPVTLSGLNEGNRDLSHQSWTYQVSCSAIVAEINGDLLVVFEEWGGDPSQISLVKRTVESVCAEVTERQPTVNNWQTKEYGRPKANLSCPSGHKISSIKFASFGTPSGECGSYSEGACHAYKSYDAFQKDDGLLQNCIGQQACSVAVVPEAFGGDPCPGTMKKLAVEAICE
ncbi:hypothetical protein KSP40_PGU008579 [Platanthera guangdongensis]|uniref:Beta-galactosidase n=1 Tax=Platanthera guangdongensis TaxID=2320717 RepID=A0ABR2N2G9_9ASPA